MRITIAICAVLLAGQASAQQPSLTLESRVTGNQQLPRVIYIQPWRQPGELQYNWQPEAGIAEDLFQPLRRDEYRRELHYRRAMSTPVDNVGNMNEIEE